jgi:D-3-phosphoglycerate dehydrogenase
VNIAGLQIARDEKKGTALSVLSVDAAVPAALIERLGAAIGAAVLRTIDIVEA